ncbi:MAG TPA: NAD(P)-dependent oxidoreductase, partial [Verrucomicrobiae bacterium]|nr:NAD(P)-dependent oxidoreductase [Verrucomicrobiae bacterium]
MKIVVLDGFALNPGDLSWDELRTLGDCAIYDRTPPSEVISRARVAEILLTNKAAVTGAQIEALAGLKYIGILATGTNVVDLPAARARRIAVTNIPGYGTKSVAQSTIALLLELTQRTGHHSDAVREGRWTASVDWCFWDHPMVELDGLTFGIIGAGHIGLAVAELARAFGMRILAHGPNRKPVPNYIQWVDLEEIFRASDVVSLHCPLTPATQSLVNAERL